MYSADGNEQEIGKVFAEVFGEGGAVKREDVFVTSKLWNSEHAPENVKPACVQTLKDLQLEYLDLYLIHWPQNFEKVEGTHKAFPRNEDGSIRYDMETTSAQTWAAMEALVAEGLVKAIGLSNFNSGQIEAIIEAGTIRPAVLQVEIHPYFSQEPLVAFCKERGIVPTAYSPLGTGQAINGQTVVGNETLAEVGATYGKSSAQVAIAWLAQRGIVVIPKSVTAARIAQNREVGFVLSVSEPDATCYGHY